MSIYSKNMNDGNHEKRLELKQNIFDGFCFYQYFLLKIPIIFLKNVDIKENLKHNKANLKIFFRLCGKCLLKFVAKYIEIFFIYLMSIYFKSMSNRNHLKKKEFKFEQAKLKIKQI